MWIFSITVLAGIIIGSLSGFLLRDQRLPRNRLSIAAVAIMILAGLAASWYGYGGIHRGLAIASWPVIGGTVVESHIEGDRAYHAVVVYEYSVQGATFQDTTSIESPSFGGRSRRYEVAVKTLAEYPPGKELEVSYNLAAPAESSIQSLVFWSYFGSVGLGIVLLGMATCFVILMSLPRRSKRPD